MPNSELRRALEQVAQQFIEGVLRAIQSVPLSAVAAELGGDGALKGLSSGTKFNGRAHARGGRSASGNNGAPSRANRRKLVRRAGSEIEGLRASILDVLRAASGPVGASEIARQLGNGVKAADLAFPMAQLRRSALVHKEGERTQTVYSLTDRGRNGEGAASPRGRGKSARQASGRKKR